MALDIEAELAHAGYQATPEELDAIDERLAGGAASEDEVKATSLCPTKNEDRVPEAGPRRS